MRLSADTTPAPTPPFQAAVFDMDGIIFDTEPIWLAAETVLLERRGMVFPPELATKIMGVPGGKAMRIVADHFHLSDDPSDLTRELNAIFDDMLATRLTLMPGLLERLDFLEERAVPKGVATSTERVLAFDMLKRFNVFDRFDFVLTRDDVTRGKPNPEIYQKACGKHGIAPRSVLVWEDSLAGSQSAHAAGCYVVTLRHPLTKTLSFDHAHLVVDEHGDRRIDELFAAAQSR